MNYNTFDMGAYKLHVINTKKFKTITISICFRREVKEEEFGFRNILKEVLLNSNNNYKEEIELIKETESLYDLKLFSSSSRIGNYTNLAIKTRFLNEKYTEKGMNEESIKFLLDIIFNPNVSNGSFKEEVVEVAKNKLLKQKESIKDDKVKYSILNLLSHFKEMPYSYDPYGKKEDIEKINGKNLYEYYEDIIKNDIVDIFVVGDVDTKKLKEIFKDNVKLNTFHKREDNLIVKELTPVKRIKKYVLTEETNQAQLILLFNINNITDFERKYVLLVYNEMLGGSSNSILFDTVREKNSYAYYINSCAKLYDNLFIIFSGIENGSEDEVLKLIRKTIDNVSKGKIEKDDIEEAKRNIISGIIASMDSPIGIINTCFARELVDSDDAETRIEKIKQVKENDIVELSKKIKLNSVLTLKGDNNGN